MRTDDVFPSRWLGGDDLPHDTTATIQRVVMEKVRNPKTRQEESKPVAYFVGKRKALILNVTNWRTLVNLYGDESDGWAGKRVILGADEVDTPQGRMKAVRVRAKVPNGGAPVEVVDEEEPEAPGGPEAPAEPEPTPTPTPTPATPPAAQPAAPVASQPAPQTANRPMAPGDLQVALTRRSVENKEKGAKATAQQLGLVMGMMNEILGGDAGRHTVLGRLWGVESGKEVKPYQALAMYEYMKPTKAGKEWVVAKHVNEELRAVLEEALADGGPTDPALFGEAGAVEG